VLGFGALACIVAERLGELIRKNDRTIVATYMVCVVLVFAACLIREIDFFQGTKKFGVGNLAESILFTIAVVFFYESVKPRLHPRYKAAYIKRK
jgi:O-antigen/teichoic acid export membrane protein